MQTAQAQVIIQNRLGLHARPAMSLVETANTFAAEIRIHKGEQVVDAKSIMQLMTLAATQGTKLEITADGEDAQKAIDAIQALVDSKFDED